MSVVVQSAPFDLAVALADFGGGSRSGAQVTFSGIVRGDDGLVTLEIEHYPAMTAKALQEIEVEARRRWALDDCLIIHRTGRLKVGDKIMMVATASKHRADAFAAAEFLMDYLKSRAPFWKKEHFADGARWVAAVAADEQALKRW